MRKKFVTALALVFVTMFATACSTAEPDAGHEAVLIMKPVLFGTGGVAKEPVRTGLTYTALTTSAVMVDMRPQEKRIEFDDLFTSNGVPLDFDSAVRFKVNDSVKLIEKFGVGWFETNLERPFRDAMRDAVKKRDMMAVAFDTSTSDAIDKEVTDAVTSLMKEADIPVTLIDVTLGRANPPVEIKNERTSAASQALRQNTEKERKLAEDQRKMAEESRAAADRAYNEKMGLDTAQYLALEQIKAMRDVCAGGKNNCSFVAPSIAALVNIK